MRREHVVRAGAVKVPFTQPGPGEELRLVSFNASESLRAYLKKAGLQRLRGSDKPRGQTDVIIKAVEFDRDLGELTKDLTARLASFAEAHGLTIEDDAAKVVARLMSLGLESWEADHKKKSR